MSDDDPRLNSASTNNLEKAYEDLEREIQEIKQKLQSSIGLSNSGGPSNLAQSHGVQRDKETQ